VAQHLIFCEKTLFAFNVTLLTRLLKLTIKHIRNLLRIWQFSVPKFSIFALYLCS